MNSNDCSGKKYADAINHLLDSGKLSPQEATHRLAAAVEHELAKAPDDVRESFILVCEDLIYAINEKDEYVSRAAASRRELEGKLARIQRRSIMTKRFIAAGGIAAALLVGVIGIDGILHREWLSGTSTPDQQQYEVVGNVVDPGLVEGGFAVDDGEIREITTASFDEAVTVLGYTPPVPAWFPEGWKIVGYYVYVDAEYSWFVIDLTSRTTDKILKYETNRYNDLESAKHAFEQNEHGNMVLCNGWNVYVTINIERSAAIWLDGSTTYSLYGPVTQDDLLQTINTIERENKV